MTPPVLTDRIAARHGAHGPSHLLWHERVVSAQGGWMQLSIPLVGRHDPALGAHLTRYLDGIWTDQPRPDGARITSVSASVGVQDGCTFLLLFLSVDGFPSGTRIDDHRMARRLRSAMQEVPAVIEPHDACSVAVPAPAAPAR